MGGYRAILSNAGVGYAITNKITISGNEVGGTSPTNDVTLEVDEVDANGVITSLIVSGEPNSIFLEIFFKVLKKRKYHLDLPIIQNILTKRNLIVLKLFQKKRIINLVVKRSLNIETDLKNFLLKNTIDPDNSVKANNIIR